MPSHSRAKCDNLLKNQTATWFYGFNSAFLIMSLQQWPCSARFLAVLAPFRLPVAYELALAMAVYYRSCFYYDIFAVNISVLARQVHDAFIFIA